MFEFLGILLGTFVLVVYLLKLYLSRNADYWKNLGFPTVKTEITFKEIITGARFPFELDRVYYDELEGEKFGGFVEIGVPVLLIKDLDIARHIFVKDFDSFFDRRDFGRSDRIFSESLFFLEGAKWKAMRAFLSPTFTSGKIRRMFQHMDRTGKTMSDYVVKTLPKDQNGHRVIVSELVRRFAVEVIGTAVFGMQTNVFTDPNSVFFKFAMRTNEFDLMRKLRIAVINNFPKFAEWLQIKFLDEETHEFLRSTIAAALKLREASNEPRDDFLQMLVEAKKGDNKLDESELNEFEKEGLFKGQNTKQKLQLTEDMAVGQAFLFFFAGLDTISNFLSFAAYIIALHPEVQEKMFNEVEEFLGKSKNKPLTYDEVNRMEYLDMFSAEVLRLFPPVVRLERKCMQDYQIPGTDKMIKKGTMVGIACEGIHRDEKHYPNPEEFDPERFNAENKANRHPYAYMPFGIGPRNCIGMRFAQIESKTALAYLVYNFKIEPTQTTQVPLKHIKEVGGYRTPKDLELRFIPRN